METSFVPAPLFQGVDKKSAGYKLLSSMGWKEGEGLVSIYGDAQVIFLFRSCDEVRQERGNGGVSVLSFAGRYKARH